MNKEPEFSIPLPKSDGEYILTQFNDNTFQLKLYADRGNQKAEIWFRGRLERL